jgi:hypothetical protein
VLAQTEPGQSARAAGADRWDNPVPTGGTTCTGISLM